MVIGKRLERAICVVFRRDGVWIGGIVAMINSRMSVLVGSTGQIVRMRFVRERLVDVTAVRVRDPQDSPRKTAPGVLCRVTVRIGYRRDETGGFLGIISLISQRGGVTKKVGKIQEFSVQGRGRNAVGRLGCWRRAVRTVRNAVIMEGARCSVSAGLSCCCGADTVNTGRNTRNCRYRRFG